MVCTNIRYTVAIVGILANSKFIVSIVMAKPKRSSSGAKRKVSRHVMRLVVVPKRKLKQNQGYDQQREISRKRKMSQSVEPQEDRGLLDALASFHALQSNAAGSNSAAAAFAEVYEWIGDAVIGELVARCLLAQFHHAPLSARVFRNLRLGVVTNQNLSHVHDLMGYGRRHAPTTAGSSDGTSFVSAMRKESRDPTRRRMKSKADIVEAVVGELVMRLDWQHNDPRMCGQYRQHLDMLVATMLRLHFADRTRAQQTGLAASGPLDLAFNPFACLPQEQLDEKSGDIIVNDGSFEWDLDMGLGKQVDEEKSYADLLEESHRSSADRHHAFIAATGAMQIDTDVYSLSSIEHIVHGAMQELDETHILRTSAEIFDVFKIYGMTVLAERVSLALARPHLRSIMQNNVATTPAALTRQRQQVLSVRNLAQCAAMLNIAAPAPMADTSANDEQYFAQRSLEERLMANTLRALMGFHSAIASTSSAAAKNRSDALVNQICQYLQSVAADEESQNPNRSAKAKLEHQQAALPEREPLVSLLRSLGEAKKFMVSPTCDSMHLAGERPPAEHRKQLLIRHCDSEQVENLFETLAKEHEREARATIERQKQNVFKKPKKPKAERHSNNDKNPTINLIRFVHRRFLFCLEELVILFARRQTEECRARLIAFEKDLGPCADTVSFRKWDVSTSTLTLALRDGFYRLLVHDLCQFHAVTSTSKTTRDGTRLTQLRLPLHYTWSKIANRITNEQDATS